MSRLSTIHQNRQLPRYTIAAPIFNTKEFFVS